MKLYTRKYMEYFGFDVSDFIPCEGCGARGTEIHHLHPRSVAKSLLNEVSNLAAVCRTCHDRADKDRDFNNELKETHRKKMFYMESIKP